MRLTKERKAYVAVFGLGLLALAADRLFFAPAGASAAPTDAVAETEPPAPPQHAEAAVEAPSGPTFVERLAKQTGWQQGPMQDAFTPPVAWIGTRVKAEGDPVVTDGAAFAAAHRLTAVAKGSKGLVALVSGKPVSQGQVLDGFTLVDVIDADVRAAIFERDGVRVQLEVAGSGASRKTDKAAVRSSQEPHPSDPAQPGPGPQNP